MLSRDAILAAADLDIHAVAVPEWGGEVHVRSLTVAEQSELSAFADAPPAEQAVQLLVRAVCAPDGARLFGPDDVAALAGKSSAAVMRVVEAIAARSAITDATVEAAAKN